MPQAPSDMASACGAPAPEGHSVASARKSQRTAALLVQGQHDPWPHKLQLDTALQKMVAMQMGLDRQWAEHYAAVDRLEAEKLELVKRNGGMKLKNRLKLSCGGVHVNTERSILRGGQLAGTRLESLFSGRWETLLLRDPADPKRIFLDCDVSCFRKILESIMMCAGPAAPFRMPSVSQELEPVLLCTLRFFGLEAVFAPCDGTPAGSREDGCGGTLDFGKDLETVAAEACSDVEPEPEPGPEVESAGQAQATQREVKTADNIQQLAKAWEGSANSARKAVREAIRKHQINCLKFEKEKVWIQQFLRKAPASPASPEVVQIDLLGERVCTRRSTLMQCAASALARQFDSTVWAQNSGRGQCGGGGGGSVGQGGAAVVQAYDSESDSDSDDDADVIYLKQVSAAAAVYACLSSPPCRR